MEKAKQGMSKLFSMILMITMVFTAFTGFSGLGTIEAKAAEKETVNVELATSIEAGEQYIFLGYTNAGTTNCALSTDNGQYASQRLEINVETNLSTPAYNPSYTDSGITEVVFDREVDFNKCVWTAEAGSAAGTYSFINEGKYLQSNYASAYWDTSSSYSSNWEFAEYSSGTGRHTLKRDSYYLIKTYSNNYFNLATSASYAAGVYHVISDDPAQPHLTVTFVANGGSDVGQQSVMTGKKVREPETTQEGKIFKGWYSDEALTAEYDFDTAVNITENSSITLYAKWSEAKTVSFDVDGGSTAADVQVAVGGKLSEPATTKDGYRIEGWYKENTFEKKWDFENDTVTSDMTLYVKWEEIPQVLYEVEPVDELEDGEQYVITNTALANSDGETGYALTSSPYGTYSYNRATRTVKLVEKDKKLYIASTIVGDDLANAVWDAAEGYYLSNTYNDSKQYVYGSYNLYSTTSTPSYKWTVTASTTNNVPSVKLGTSYGLSYSLSVGATNASMASYTNYVRLYQLVDSDAAEFTVTFDPNGGEFDSTLDGYNAVTKNLEQTVKENKKAKTPAEPEKDGYSLAGWYTDAEGGTEYDFSTPVTKDVTLYAKWQPAKEVLVEEATSLEDGSTYIVFNTTYQKAMTGNKQGTYNYLQSIGATLNAAGTKLKFASESDYEQCVWTATASGSYHTLQIGSNYLWENTSGGVFAQEAAPSTTAYNTFTIDSVYGLRIHTGSSLSNYIIRYNSGTSYQSFGGQYFSSSAVNDRVKVYEVITNKYNVSFVTNKDDVTVETQEVKEGKTATKPDDIVKDGSMIEGWYTDEACTNAYDFSTPVTENITLYAKWKTAHTVTFEVNGGTSIDAKDYPEGAKIAEPSVTKKNYDLEGWYTDEACTAENKWNFATDVLGAADMTLYANWTAKVPKSYKVVLADTLSAGEEYFITMTSLTDTDSTGYALSRNRTATDNVSVEPIKAEKKDGKLYLESDDSTAAGEVGLELQNAIWKAEQANTGYKLLSEYGNDKKYINITGSYSSTLVLSNLSSYAWTVEKTNESGAPAVKLKSTWSSYNYYLNVSALSASTSSAGVTRIYQIIDPSLAEYTVTYNSDGGSAVASVTGYATKKLAKPADPQKDGYFFDGWYKDEALTQEWDFSTDTVTADTTLYAKWNKAVTVDVKKATKLEAGKTYIIKAPSGDVAMTSMKASNAGNSNYLAPGAAFINSTKDIISFQNNAALEAVEWTAAAGTADGYVKLQNDGKDLYQYYSYAAAATTAPSTSYTNNFKLDDNGKLQSASTSYTTYRIAFSASSNYFNSSSSTAYMADVYEVIPAHDHNYVKHEAKGATCEEAGTTPTYWQCDVCGKTYADEKLTTKIDPSTITVTPALGHAWGEWKADEGADTHTRVCANDSSHTETEAHAWDNGKVTTKPTATTHGVRTYTCKVCGATKTEDIVTLCGKNTSSEMTVTVQNATALSADKEYIFVYENKAMAAEQTTFKTYTSASTSYEGLRYKDITVDTDSNMLTFADEETMNAVLWKCESGTTDSRYSFVNNGAYLWTSTSSSTKIYLSENAPASSTSRDFYLDTTGVRPAGFDYYIGGYYLGKDYADAFALYYNTPATVYEVVRKEGGTASHSLSEITKTGCDGAEHTYYPCSECGKLFADKLGETEVTDRKKHTLIHVDAASATCEETGNIAYYECAICKKYFKDDAGSEEITDKTSVTIPELGHDYELEEWTWSGGGFGTVYKKAEELSDNDYVIVANSNGKQYALGTEPYAVNAITSLKADEVSADDNVVSAAESNVWSYKDGKLKNKATGQYLAADTSGFGVVLADTTDQTWTYTNGTFTTSVSGDTKYLTFIENNRWFMLSANNTAGVSKQELYQKSADEGDTSAIATFVCKHDDTHIVNKTAEVKEDDQSKCDAIGQIVYTASVTGPDDKTYTDSKSAPTAPTGHTWGKLTVTKAAACGEAGEAERTCSVCGKKEVIELPALEHRLKKSEAKAATCVEDGNIEYWTCRICDKIFSDEAGSKEISVADTVIKATGHTLKKTEAVAVTCETDGNIAYWTCDTCGKIFADEAATREITEADTVIKATGHSWSEWTTTKEASCEEDGSAERICDICKEKETKVLPAFGHKLNKTEAKTATCEEDGNIGYYTCSNCGKIFSDANGTKEISADQITIKATGHDWKFTDFTWTEQEDGGYSAAANYTCGNDAAHTVTVKASAALLSNTATCDTAGKTTWKATVEAADAPDQQERTETKEIDAKALGHALTKTEEVPASCEKDGTIAYWTCDICGKTFRDEAGTEEVTEEELVIPATGHDWGDWVVLEESTCTKAGQEVKECKNDPNHKWYRDASLAAHDMVHTEAVEATCEEDGNIEYWTCKTCNGVFSDAAGTRQISEEDIIIKAAGHKLNKTEALAATCEEDGNIEYYSCSVCGKIFSDAAGTKEITLRDTVLQATGHDWSGWKVTKPATVNADGVKERVCSLCGEVETEVIPKLNGINLIRIAGENRYETSMKVADEILTANGDETFDTVIVTTGQNFADALSGSYLAKVKNAPILLIGKSDEEVKQVTDYISQHLNDGGTVYVLGGTNAVPDTVEKNLAGYEVDRLAGENRYETNILILKEAGVSTEEILVCTGTNYADSLSASATGKPILLVGNTLDENQIEWLGSLSKRKYDIIGGTSAVTKSVEEQLSAYSTGITRIAGDDRYKTSVKVAQTFFKNPSEAVLTVGTNFPDGLSGGPLTITEGIPLLLAAENAWQDAEAYCKAAGVHGGYVLGGAGLISDQTAMKVLQLK